MARIVGLDVYGKPKEKQSLRLPSYHFFSAEGVVLIGKDSIYSIDSYFKRSDGEYVDIDNAPDKERNVYNLMLTESRDSKVSDENSNSEGRYSTRKW